jgi:hypothetical protein
MGRTVCLSICRWMAALVCGWDCRCHRMLLSWQGQDIIRFWAARSDGRPPGAGDGIVVAALLLLASSHTRTLFDGWMDRRMDVRG